MRFTDLFIHRPVLASVVSLLILVLGLRAVLSLEVRQYPATADTVVTVATAYPGASAELIHSGRCSAGTRVSEICSSNQATSR